MAYKFVNKNWKENLIKSKCSNYALDSNMVAIDIRAFDSANIEEYPNPVDILQADALGYDVDQDAWIVEDIQSVIDFFLEWEEFRTDADIEFRAENDINCDYRRWFNYEYEQLYITDDVEDAITIANMVVPSKTTTLQYNEEYRIDIEEVDNMWNAYIYKQDYDVKMHMFGQEAFGNGYDNINDFIILAIDVAEEYIPVYNQELDDLEESCYKRHFGNN